MSTTRDRTKRIAGDLYVLKGHDGFSFGDVAAAVGTTRANIHHHFGSKQQLMNELVADFSADAAQRIARLWTAGDASFQERLESQIANLHSFYVRFNPNADDRNSWSPIARMRLDLPKLGEAGVRALEQVDRTYQDCLAQAVRQAIAAGELRADLKVEDVARVIRVAITAGPPLTQDSGGFAELELTLRALGRILSRATD